MLLFELFEADEPIDFMSRKKQKDAEAAKANIPDSIRFKAAAVKQNTGEPKQFDSMSDYARDIVLRNLDKIMAGEQLPQEDADGLKNVLAADFMFKRIIANSIAQKMLDHLNKLPDANNKYWTRHPDLRGAYLEDDPVQQKFRLVIKDKQTKKIKYKTFDTSEAMYKFVIHDLGDVTTIDFSDDEKDKLQKVNEFFDMLDKDKDTDNWDKYLEKNPDPKSFDPDARPKNWEGHNQMDELKPSIEKYLNSLRKRTDTKPIGSDEYDPISIYHHALRGEDGTMKWELVFFGPNIRDRKRIFQSTEEFERWVITHKGALERFINSAQSGQKTKQMGLIKMAQNRLVDAMKKLESGQWSDDDIEAMKHFTWDRIDRIENEKLKELFRSLSYDLRNPRMHPHISTDYWISELNKKVKEILSDN